MKRSMSVMGYVGNDPETKITQNGSQFVSFRLGNSAYGDPKDATGKEITSWFNVTVYNPQLQKLAQTIKKGSCIDIIGDYKDRLYQTKDGSVQISRDIIASAIYFGPSLKNDNIQGQVAKPSVTVNPGIANPVTPVYPQHTVLNPATNPMANPAAVNPDMIQTSTVGTGGYVAESQSPVSANGVGMQNPGTQMPVEDDLPF